MRDDALMSLLPQLSGPIPEVFWEDTEGNRIGPTLQYPTLTNGYLGVIDKILRSSIWNDISDVVLEGIAGHGTRFQNKWLFLLDHFKGPSPVEALNEIRAAIGFAASISTVADKPVPNHSGTVAGTSLKLRDELNQFRTAHKCDPSVASFQYQIPWHDRDVSVRPGLTESVDRANEFDFREKNYHFLPGALRLIKDLGNEAHLEVIRDHYIYGQNIEKTDGLIPLLRRLSMTFERMFLTPEREHLQIVGVPLMDRFRVCDSPGLWLTVVEEIARRRAATAPISMQTIPLGQSTGEIMAYSFEGSDPSWSDGLRWEFRVKNIVSASLDAIDWLLSLLMDESQSEHAREGELPVVAATGGQMESSVDGPKDDYGFRWNGVRVDLQPRPWRLLKCMWGVDSLPIEDAMAIVVDDEVADDWNESAVKSAIHLASKALVEVGYTKTIGHKKSKIIWK